MNVQGKGMNRPEMLFFLPYCGARSLLFIVKKLIKTSLIIFAVTIALPAVSAEKALPVIIDESKEVYDIGRNLEILEDPSGISVFSEVSDPAFDNRFIPSRRDVPNYSMSKSIFWIRFGVTIPPGSPASKKKWLLKCEWPHLTSVNAYLRTSGKPDTKDGSAAIFPYLPRDFSYKGYLFNLPDRQGETYKVYVRVQSDGAIVLPFSVISEKELLSGIAAENKVIGLFFGIMLVMIFYHLMLFAVVRDRDYLYFAGFLASSVIFYMLNEGIFEEHVRMGGVVIRTFLMSVTAAGAAAMATLFTIYMLNLKKDLPSAAKLLYGFIILYAGAAFSSFVFSGTVVWSAIFLLSLVQDFIIVIIAVVRLTQRFRIALFFIIVSLFNLTSNSSYMLVRLDLIPYDLFSGNILVFFTIAQSFVFSYFLSARIKRIEKGRLDAQALAIEHLKKAERMKDEFLANTSHELKTPLHGIVGLSELMLSSGNGKLGKDTVENLGLISASGRRLINLVNDILDFSSIRHGSLALSVKPVKLRESVNAVFSLLRPLTEGKAIELRNGVPADFTNVIADESRLRQILTNLVGNALKFVPFGVIEVSASYRDDMAVISVSDTGAGIKREDLQRIFEAFEQGESSSSRTYGGTGLGLAICRKLVELHGGSITVDSEPGKGTTFTFTLPLEQSGAASIECVECVEQPSAVTSGDDSAPDRTDARVADNDCHDGASARDAHAGNAGTGARASILVVEDDPVSRKILRDSLSRLTYEVRTADNGFDALELIGSGRYDLMLLDVMMPGMSGYELLERIRVKWSPEELPVILVTAKSQLDDIHAGFKAGANDYIIKPFSMDELSLRVANMLRLKKVLPPEEPGLMIREKGSTRIIRYREIVYIASIGKKTVVHTTGHDVTASMMLKDIEVKLPGSFIRIHKQHIINRSFLSGVTHTGSGRYEVILNDADDTRLAVGRAFLSALRRFVDDGVLRGG